MSTNTSSVKTPISQSTSKTINVTNKPIAKPKKNKLTKLIKLNKKSKPTNNSYSMSIKHDSKKSNIKQNNDNNNIKQNKNLDINTFQEIPNKDIFKQQNISLKPTNTNFTLDTKKIYDKSTNKKLNFINKLVNNKLIILNEEIIKLSNFMKDNSNLNNINKNHKLENQLFKLNDELKKGIEILHKKICELNIQKNIYTDDNNNTYIQYNFIDRDQKKSFEYTHITLHSIESFLPDPIDFLQNCAICLAKQNKKTDNDKK